MLGSGAKEMNQVWFLYSRYNLSIGWERRSHKPMVCPKPAWVGKESFLEAVAPE